MTVTVEELLARWDPTPIRGCPGRFVLRGAAAVAPEVLAPGVAIRRVAGDRDPVVIAALDDGGLISYAKPDGTWVHTAATPDGFARKLAALGV